MADNPGNKGSSLWGARRAPIPSPAAPSRQPAADPNPRVLPIKPGDAESRVYRAVHMREHSARLDIRCARGPSHFPDYRYLLNILYDYDFSSAATLVYTFMVVEITGQNLEPVVHAIAHGSAERITEFHPRRHDRPAEGEPLIERIEIVAAAEPTQR